MEYLPRIIESELRERLEGIGAIVLEGPKTCGKTATARQLAASEVLLDVDKNAKRMAGVNPWRLLRGPKPRLIDEWQEEPVVWNHIRRAVDDATAPGQFLLTGSAVPPDDATRHTGAGRFARLRMRPLTLFEAGQSTGGISLRRLLDRAPQETDRSLLAIQELAEWSCPGFVDSLCLGIQAASRWDFSKLTGDRYPIAE